MSEKTLSLPKFGRVAEIRASSFDEADNSIEVIWTTGASVRRRDWRTGAYYNEVLVVTSASVRLGRLNSGAPLLDTHNDWSLRSVIGSIVPGSAKLSDGKGVARVQLSKAPGDADIVSKIRDGIIRNISVGYAIHRVEKIETEGADDEWRVVDWEPLEISAVPIPADAGSQFRNSEDEYPCEFTVSRNNTAPEADKEPKMAEKLTTEATRNNQETETQVADTAVDTRTGVTVDMVDKAADKAVQAERKRAAEINALADKFNERAFASTYVEGGKSVDEFRKALIDHLAAKEPMIDTNSRAQVGTEHHEKRAACMQEALMHRADPSKDLSEGAREYRGFTLLDMAREALEVQGTKTRGMSREDIARDALAQRSGYGSTSDFPIILGNVINTTLRAAYEAAGQTFRPLVRETSMPDFKQVHRAQLGEGPAFDKVNEHGEFKRGSVKEGKESYKIATYGKIIAITRQVIVNDDMNAFGRIPQLQGAAAAQLESDLVWYQILANAAMGDGKALFHADHNNLGTAAAFGVGPLGAARAQMTKQVGLDGKTVLNIRPSFVIVPVELETKAEQELHSTFYPDQSEKVATKSMRSLQIIAEARLDNGINNPAVGAKINGSTKAWYLAASPSQIDTVEIAYLEGQRGVYTESRHGFDVDGVEFKARLDVGAKTMDHRGLYMNAGA